MRLVTGLSVLHIILVTVENRIYLYNTNEGVDIEYYDCVLAQSLFYCRRPREPINLTRDDDILLCEHNDGQLHRFSALRSNNVTVRTIFHQWKSSLERVEQYSLFLTEPNQIDGHLCQCRRRGSFGKNCEYQLPVGETFEETLQWQLTVRRNNPRKVQMYGDVVCYETLKCDSGVLCLDWREICDGIQNCLEGRDEENCDLLEMNQCDPEKEYRCQNGMCIPQQFFLDGDLDCFDWSDEIPLKGSQECPLESVNTVCDDHLCPPDQWSCGDGQCIPDGKSFLKGGFPSTCDSGRDQYFICELHATKIQWTMPNGRCHVEIRDGRYEEYVVANRSEDEQWEYLLKCARTWGVEIGCSCYSGPECAEKLGEFHSLSSIQYPRGAIIAPYLFFLFNRTRHWKNPSPDSILINGTMRCGDDLISVTKTIPFAIDLDGRRLTEKHFCGSRQKMITSENIDARHRCRQSNESTDRCGEWNPCLSKTRIRDGWKNCLNGSDEEEQTAMQIEKSCAQVRRHRFRCSREQPTCLSVVTLGNQFDEL